MSTATEIDNPIETPIHTEIPHGDPTAPWKDNAYVAFWDPDQHAFGVIHMSTSPNAEGRRARISLHVDGIVTEVIEELPPCSYQSESIAFDLQGRVTVDHPDLTMSLALTQRLALGNFSPAGHEIIPPMGGAPVQHFEQTVDVTGPCVINGRELHLRATGIRDRTFGYRDESVGTDEYVWFFITFPTYSLVALRFTGDAGYDRTGGFVLTQQEARPLTRFSVTRDASGLAAGGHFELANGDSIAVRSLGRQGGFWIPMSWERSGPTMSAYDEFCGFRADDGTEGFGVVEHGQVRKLY